MRTSARPPGVGVQRARHPHLYQRPPTEPVLFAEPSGGFVGPLRGPPGPLSVMSMTTNAQGMVLCESSLAGAGR